MNILMILSNPLITDGRVIKEAKALVDEGNKVTVIVWDRKRKHKPKDSLDGINIVRIHNNLLMKVLPNDTFRNPIWWRTAYKKGMELYKAGYEFDVVHCHDLDTLQTGVRLKKKTGCKLVYDVHEIFPYMIQGHVPRIVVRFTCWFEKRLIRHVDRVIAVSEPVKNYLSTITDLPVNIVMNCKSLISDRYIPPRNNTFTVCYIGSFVKSRMFPELVDVIGGIDNVRFVVAGTKNELYEEVKLRCWSHENCEFLGALPDDDVVSKTLDSNAVICMFNPDRLIHQIGLPSKVFESMVAGRPIIVTKDMYYSNNFVDKENFGLSVENNNAGVRNAVIKLRDNQELCEELGRNGLKVALTTYNWNKEQKELIEVYENL